MAQIETWNGLVWPFLLFCLAVLVNAITFLAFGIDKARAMRGEWRISEATLLLLALFGGWFGAKWAQRRFRHKTRKHPFGTLLNGIPIL